MAMNLVEIEDIGHPACWYPVAVKDNNGIWYLTHVDTFNKQTHRFSINIDNIISISKERYDLGDSSYGKNPLKKSFWDFYEKMAWIFMKTGEIEVYEVKMVNGTVFYLDASKEYAWMKH